jgi:hypothetical protein
MKVNKRLNAEELEAIRYRAGKLSKGNILRDTRVLALNNKVVFEDVPKLLAEIARLQTRLYHAGDILSEAHDLLDDVHCYDTDVYNAISRYFNGEDDSDDSDI